MIINGGPAEPVIRALINETRADIYVYSADITDDFADAFITKVRAVPQRRENAVLALSTLGGSPDAAYRIARCIKRHYSRFILHVYGVCYSAGTLIAVGSDEIVMSECGQLGPLDVQLADKTEFFGQTAALDVSQALETLSVNAFTFFTSHFVNMGPGRGISTQTASDIAQALTLGIIEPIAKQIDPLLLGRVDRSMRIAEAYATRLNPSFRNTKRLVQEYPSHEFVIDITEAREIFANVRQPSQCECAFENVLRRYNLSPNQHENGYVEHIEVALPPPPPDSFPNETVQPANDRTHYDSTSNGNGDAPPSVSPVAAPDDANTSTQPAGGVHQRQD